MSTNTNGARRRIPALACTILALATTAIATAGALDALTNKDASGGLRAALGQGIDAAVGRLGVADGFLGNPKVAIPLPPALDKIDRTLRRFGMGGEADKLKVAMNHAAEAAVAESKPILKDALKRMTVADAKAILTGDDDAATRYFQNATSETAMKMANLKSAVVMAGRPQLLPRRRIRCSARAGRRRRRLPAPPAT